MRKHNALLNIIVQETRNCYIAVVREKRRVFSQLFTHRINHHCL